MNILIACENSNALSAAFRSRGHYVLSVDLMPSPNSPNHYTGDVFDVIDQGWDMLIGHPPCTYLCKAQLWKCVPGSYREKQQIEAIDFFTKLLKSDVPRIALENPAGILSAALRPYDFMIQPHHFGDPYKKEICFWTKNMCPILPTEMSPERKSVRNHSNSRMSAAQRSIIHSSWKYFPKMCESIALQWG